jgi:hypothetical protein
LCECSIFSQLPFKQSKHLQLTLQICPSIKKIYPVENNHSIFSNIVISCRCMKLFLLPYFRGNSVHPGFRSACTCTSRCKAGWPRNTRSRVSGISIFNSCRKLVFIKCLFWCFRYLFQIINLIY